MLPVVLLLALLPQSGFDRGVVWNPPPDFRVQVFSACDNAPGGFGGCFLSQMKRAGASPQALAFTNRIEGDGYVSAFRPLGRLSAALVNYPFRANENNGLVILNGTPTVVDVDDSKYLRQDQLQSIPQYAALLKSHPDASLWPGDRSTPDDLLVLSLPGGSRQFIAGYRIQAGCHACAVLGQAFFGFVFDANGEFQRAEPVGFTTEYTPGSASSNKSATVRVGTSFSLLLPANPTTGYGWTLASSGKSQTLQPLGHQYHPASTPALGAGGEEHWSFRANTPGQSVLNFSYQRPWEKNLPPAKTLVVTVRVR